MESYTADSLPFQDFLLQVSRSFFFGVAPTTRHNRLGDSSRFLFFFDNNHCNGPLDPCRAQLQALRERAGSNMVWKFRESFRRSVVVGRILADMDLLLYRATSSHRKFGCLSFFSNTQDQWELAQVEVRVQLHRETVRYCGGSGTSLDGAISRNAAALYRFHFSFAEYHNYDNSNFGVLRVMNDDLVQPHRGFGTHPHANMVGSIDNALLSRRMA